MRVGQAGLMPLYFYFTWRNTFHGFLCLFLDRIMGIWESFLDFRPFSLPSLTGAVTASDYISKIRMGIGKYL